MQHRHRARTALHDLCKGSMNLIYGLHALWKKALRPVSAVVIPIMGRREDGILRRRLNKYLERETGFEPATLALARPLDIVATSQD